VAERQENVIKSVQIKCHSNAERKKISKERTIPKGFLFAERTVLLPLLVPEEL